MYRQLTRGFASLKHNYCHCGSSAREFGRSARLGFGVSVPPERIVPLEAPPPAHTHAPSFTLVHALADRAQAHALRQ